MLTRAITQRDYSAFKTFLAWFLILPRKDLKASFNLPVNATMLSSFQNFPKAENTDDITLPAACYTDDAGIPVA